MNTQHHNALDMGDSDSEEEVEYENECFNLRGLEMNVTTVSFMPLSKLMQLHDKETEISGQKLWCGSLVVVEYLLDHPEFIRDCNVLELGSGTGVVGMLCKKLGANQVILSDHDQRSIDHMTQDIVKNSVDVNILNLDWFTFQRTQLSADFLHSQPFRLVAGDVLYKHLLIQPFFTVLQQLLCHIPGSQILLCHVPRAGVEQSDVIKAAGEYGLKISAIPSELWMKGVCIEHSVADDYERAQLYLLESLE
jgi:predicted nicotinamide N-methyase